MDICHLKNAELEAKHQKYKGRVVLRGDIVKVDSGSYAVFTEQGSSASQMTAAKVMDIISRLPGCAGQAADAASADTQVKMEDAPKLLKIPRSECPGIWIRLPPHKWPKSWSSMEDPVVPLERNLYGHPLAGLSCERQFEKILLKYGWEKVSNWECLFVHREKGLFFSVYVDDIKIAGKKQNINPMWKVLNKEVDLGEPTSFLDHLYLDCTQRQCEISKDIVDNYRTMFEYKISAGATENLPCSENLSISSWSYDMECHAEKRVERYCELANKNDSTTPQSINSMLWRPSFRRRSIEIRGRLVKSMLSNCSEMLIFWHVLDDVIFYGQWTNLHDRSQNGPKLVATDYVVWSLTFITHVIANNIVMWETLPNNADWDCFKTPILQEIMRIQNLHQVEHCAFLEVIRLFQSVGCVRIKLQFRTVQQNQKSFPWTQDWGWMVYPRLIHGIWSLQFFTETRIRVIKNGETRARTQFVQHLTNFQCERHFMEWLMI